MAEDNHYDIESIVFSYLLRLTIIIPLRWKRWLAIYYPDARIRKHFWKETFVEMGVGTFSNMGMIVSDDYASSECLLSIGDNVSIAPSVVFVPFSSPNNSTVLQCLPHVSENLIKREKIIIDDNVWIGAHVTILPGVTVGKCSIIGSGAVVTQSVPPYCIVAGVPAKVIRYLNPPS